MEFQVQNTCGKARQGELKFDRGTVRTPAFMPVGTYGTVKAMTPGEVRGTGADIILGNTFHLMLQPGTDVIEQHGGLHGFMQWKRPILTDSGGIQEEAAILKVPCLTLRENTERPVTVDQGTNVLVGGRSRDILAACGQLHLKDSASGASASAPSRRAAHCRRRKTHRIVCRCSCARKSAPGPFPSWAGPSFSSWPVSCYAPS